MKKILGFAVALSVMTSLFLGCGSGGGGSDGGSWNDDSYTSWDDGNYTYYTVTYDSNGGTTSAIDYHEYYSGGTVTVETTDDYTTYKYIDSGKLTLDSWNTKADGSGTSYKAGDTFTITANTTLYAQWNKYYVGQRVTASDIFGKTVTGYIAYIRPEGKYTFYTNYTSGLSTSSSSYTISNAGGRSWKYLVAVMDGTSSADSYKYMNLAWAPNAMTIVGGLSENIGAGKANSDAIIASYAGATTSNCAAKALETSNNCYLPSVGEMAVIFQNLFYSGKVTPPTYSTGVLGSVSYYYTSNQSSSEPQTDALAFDMYKTSLTGGSSISHTKTPASNAAWFVCTLGVSYLP